MLRMLALSVSFLALLPIASNVAEAKFPTDDFIVSYWCGPRPDMDQDARYKQVAAAYFNYCMPPCESATDQQQALALEACVKTGLRYFVSDAGIWAHKPDDPEFGAAIDAIVEKWSKHPSLAGYFITDEPGVSAFPTLAAINQRLLQKDPSHLPFINLLPNYATPDQLGAPTYEEYIDKFCSLVKPRLLSYDHYALLNDNTERPEYFGNMEIIRRQGLKHKIPTCDILLVIPHGPYRSPSDGDMRWQVNTALAYGMKAILYFTYWTPPPSDPLWQSTHGAITHEGQSTERYSQVQQINRELMVLAPTLMKLTSTAVYHTGVLPAGTVAVAKSSPIQVVSGGPVVLGMFKHQDGSSWAMVANSDPRKPVQVSLQARGFEGIRQLSAKTGRLDDLIVFNGRFVLRLAAGEGRLLKLGQ